LGDTAVKAEARAVSSMKGCREKPKTVPLFPADPYRTIRRIAVGIMAKSSVFGLLKMAENLPKKPLMKVWREKKSDIF